MSCRDVATRLAVILLAIAVTGSHAQATFNYTDQAAWNAVPDWTCDGQRQTPIDITTASVVANRSLVALELTNSGQNFSGALLNSGRNIRFTPNSSIFDPVDFVSHLGAYRVLQFHFHWGASSTLGSGHRINGRAFGGEIHFVTLKPGADFSNLQEDSVAVMSVLLISDSSMPLVGVWRQFVEQLPSDNGESNPVEGVELADFMPESLSYYYYPGSQTSPPCNEVVHWFVLRDQIRVPAEFLDALRTNVNSDSGMHLGMNFRQPQALNGRQVMTRGSASSMNFNSCLLVLVILAAYMVM